MATNSIKTKLYTSNRTIIQGGSKVYDRIFIENGNTGLEPLTGLQLSCKELIIGEIPTDIQMKEDDLVLENLKGIFDIWVL